MEYAIFSNGEWETEYRIYIYIYIFSVLTISFILVYNEFVTFV